MIKSSTDQDIAMFDAMIEIVNSQNSRFPNGNEIFQRVSRLAEETGELAKAVNHRENMGIKSQKHGEPMNRELAHEALDVVGAALDIVLHYDLLGELQAVLQERYRAYEAKNFYKD